MAKSPSRDVKKSVFQMYLNPEDPYDKMLLEFVRLWVPEDGKGNASLFLKRCVEFYYLCSTGKLPGGEVKLPFFSSPSPMFHPPTAPVFPDPQYQMELERKRKEEEERERQRRLEEEKKQKRSAIAAKQGFIKAGKR